MLELNEFFIYLITGAGVGFLAGIFGIGGGLIIVPILTSAFAIYLVPSTNIVHLAIGTSMATVIVTSFSAIRTHYNNNIIQWDIVKSIVPSIFLGGFLGGWITQFINSSILGVIFGSCEVLIGLYLLSNLQAKPQNKFPSTTTNIVAGGIIGSISSLMGIGGGTLVSPYLIWHRISYNKAISVAITCSFPVAISGTIGFILAGQGVDNLPDLTLGYIYIPAFLGIVIISYFTAPIGARMSHKISGTLLKRILGIIILILGIRMFLI